MHVLHLILEGAQNPLEAQGPKFADSPLKNDTTERP